MLTPALFALLLSMVVEGYRIQPSKDKMHEAPSLLDLLSASDPQASFIGVPGAVGAAPRTAHGLHKAASVGNVVMGEGEGEGEGPPEGIPPLGYPPLSDLLAGSKNIFGDPYDAAASGAPAEGMGEGEGEGEAVFGIPPLGWPPISDLLKGAPLLQDAEKKIKERRAEMTAEDPDAPFTEFMKASEIREEDREAFELEMARAKKKFDAMDEDSEEWKKLAAMAEKEYPIVKELQEKIKA